MTQNLSQYINNLEHLVQSYDGFLFDAYGVLMDADGPIAGAVEAWHKLTLLGKPCWILSNGSSRTLHETLMVYRAMGLDLEPAQVISSGSLLPRYFEEHALRGAATAVLGTDGSRQLCTDAGGRVVDLLVEQDFLVLVLANQTDYPLLPSLDAALTIICRRLEAGLPCHLILTNPDLIYPKAQRSYGFTAGSLALMLEAGMKLRLGPLAPAFVRLGKPAPRIFAEAERRAGSRRLLMIGDQLETDILGASAYGFDTVLVETGISQNAVWPNYPIRPTYILKQWRS